jgi:Calx-beta domain/RTX calcium-binding nonapeptide repeat (4 copies)
MSTRTSRSLRPTRRIAGGLTVVAGALATILVASAVAANIQGTARADTLRGTPRADKLYGKGGNDKLFGLGGADYVNGGPGNDVLTGGPGADVLACGPGADTAAADAADKVGADCEKVTGLPKPALSVADFGMAEGSSGSQSMQIPVMLAKPSPLRVTVAYATQDGTATAGSDYTSVSGALTFAPGATIRTIAVPVVGDTSFEPDETFTLVLSSPVNAELGAASATAMIRNDDANKPKAGRYTGTTSQGKSFTFDVNADATGITAINMMVDLPCQGVSVVLRDLPLNLTGFAPLTPDFRFVVNLTDSDADGSVVVAITGAMAVGAPASGTLKVDLTVNTSAGPVICSTGALTWNATPPA